MEARAHSREQYEVSPLKLWSPLHRQLAACGQSRATPQQWIGTVRNLQNKGVSKVEIEWSQIIPLLEACPDEPLEIAEILDTLAHRPPCELVLGRYVTDEYAPYVSYAKQPRPIDAPLIATRKGTPEVRWLQYYDRTFGLCVWLHEETEPGLFGRHRYWSFSVPRGRKKIAPYAVARNFASAHEAMAYGRTLVYRMARRLATSGFVGQTKSVNKFTRYVLPGGEKYSEQLITAPNVPANYWGPHFDLPNIIAHVRTTERVTPGGARLLVLEEIQSDWNQELREAIKEARARHPVDNDDSDNIEWDADMDPPPFNPYLNHWLEAALRMMLLLGASHGCAGIASLPGNLHAERFPWANSDGLEKFYDDIVPAAMRKLGKSWNAEQDVAQFSTLTRKYEVRAVTGGGTWQVFNRSTRKLVGEEFADWLRAEVFRRRMESVAMETVNVLYISEAMKADIEKNGLPCLGAVGKRLETTSKQNG